MAIDYEKVQTLLNQIEAEVKNGKVLVKRKPTNIFQKLFGVKPQSLRLPLRRLRVKKELGDEVIAWSYYVVNNEDLDTDAAKNLLDSRLASLGLQTGPGSLTNDNDGSVLSFWKIKEQSSHQETHQANKKNLSRPGSPLSTEELISMLSSPDAKTRREAALELGKRKDPQTVSPLATALLKETNYQDYVLEGMINALGDIGGQEAAEALAESLIRHTRHEARGTLEDKVLSKMGHCAVEPLIRVLKSDSVKARWRAAWALAEIKDVSAGEALREALKKYPDEGAGREALRGLEALKKISG